MYSLPSLEDVKQLISYLGKEMEAHSEELRVLDSAMGDGDLGVTMTLGGRALQEVAMSSDTDNLGEFLVASGMRFNQAAASTFGVSGVSSWRLLSCSFTASRSGSTSS